MPDVSVLMPYRDAAHTLEEALDSVLGQTGVHLEVCIVDDGSQDSGPDIVRRLAAQHAGLRPSKTGGVGIARALNHAAKMAEAPYFARMDADDIAKPQRLAMQLDVLRRRPELAVLGSQVEAFPEANVQDGLRHYVAWQNRLLTPEQHRQQIDPAALDALGKALGDPDPQARSAAIYAYWTYGDGRVIDAIKARLEEEESSADFIRVNEDLKRLLVHLQRRAS